ncbi:MAG TPA: cupredoxin domain-containing protein [Dehalococcoidia bacterium]|nr:cupredoxin domain-containing protein [Dehalococcoidia bacterium]
MNRALVIGLVVLSAVLSLAIAGCSGGDDEEAGSAMEVRASEYKFSPDEITVPAGQTVTLRLKNVGETEHDLEVQGLRVQMMGDEEDMGGHEGAAPGTIAMHTQKGKTASVTFMADQKGTYEFWCTISGHKEQGMIGKLIVN